MKVVKRRFPFFIALLILFLVDFGGCSSCYTNNVTGHGTDYVSFDLTVVNPDASSFIVHVNPFNPIQSGTFQMIEVYNRPGETPPNSIRTFKFFIKSDALPANESIFDQKMGEQFMIPAAPYDGTTVIYEEYGPGSDPSVPFWKPTSYQGQVSFPADSRVHFDITFSDGAESRRVIAEYDFFIVKGSTQSGNCD